MCDVRRCFFVQFHLVFSSVAIVKKQKLITSRSIRITESLDDTFTHTQKPVFLQVPFDNKKSLENFAL